ncbi:MAG: BlaI/MecI/CopY family transcriptional regulator [Lachnospiraceae bacterium]|nr:BlaI/MecI/CopY family transcriptional regulator [Lachnospiraceae bacterium]
MLNEESLPTEREWLLMEVIWDSEAGITSGEILERVNSIDEMSPRTERVLLHHLCRKELVGYTVDEHDSRLYHYFAKCTREECLEIKRKSFVDTYYRGDESMALASFIHGVVLTDDQIKELTELLESSKGKKRASRKKKR